MLRRFSAASELHVSRIYLRLLGSPYAAADEGDKELLRITTRKEWALLAYLAIMRGRRVPREHLCSLLWGEVTDRQARQSLRQTLTYLRKDLATADIIETDSDAVWLNTRYLSVDALEFHDLCNTPDVAELERARALWRGEFMAGFTLSEEPYEEWLREQRHRLQTCAAKLLETLAAQYDATGMGEQSLAVADQLVTIDPLREDWHRLVLTLYARQRGPHEALAKARYFTEVLRRELQAAPDRASQALVRQLQDAADAAPMQIPDCAPSAIAESTPKVSTPTQVRPLPSRRGYRPLLVAGLCVASFLAIGISYFFSPPLRSHTTVPVWLDAWTPPPLPTKPAVLQPRRPVIPIAVLPLTSYGDGSEGDDIAADMMTDDIINTLARVPLIRVISRQTSRRYRGTEQDIGAIGKELAVQYILEGSLRRSDGKLRVNVELVDPATKAPVWSTRIERSQDEEVRSIHDEIVGRLARELQVEVYLANAKGSNDRKVDVLVFQGFAAILASSTTGLSALKTAESYFLNALQLDSNSRSAKTGLGAFHTLMAVMMLAPNYRDHLRAAETILHEIIGEDPSASTAHYFLGLVHEAHGRVDEALSSYVRCVEINPSSAFCHAQIGHILIGQGQPKEALVHIRYAQRLSPQDPHRVHWLRFAGEAFLELGEYSEAITSLKQAYALNPRSLPTLRALAATMAVAGDLPQSQKYIAELKSLAPYITDERLLARMAYVGAHQVEFVRGLRLAVGTP